jgi:hypothetical protein
MRHILLKVSASSNKMTSSMYYIQCKIEISVCLTHILMQLQYFHFLWYWMAWRWPVIDVYRATCLLLSSESSSWISVNLRRPIQRSIPEQLMVHMYHLRTAKRYWLVTAFSPRNTISGACTSIVLVPVIRDGYHFEQYKWDLSSHCDLMTNPRQSEIIYDDE